MRLLIVPFGVLLAACGPDVSITKRSVDEDSDGYSSEVDCDDAHASVNPDALELCDGLDNDCDGVIDDAATDAPTWYADADSDGAGDDAAPTVACDAPSGHAAAGGDCDDSDATAFPGAAEACDGVDDDCDGAVDEDAIDVVTSYLDADGDDYGDPALPHEGCEPPDGYVADGTDCDDARGDVHPGADEADCADPTDYNCDGSVGYVDADRDGVAACEDCDDADPARSPLLAERCDPDDVDEDCDGSADDEDEPEDASTWTRDRDGDGYGDPSGPALDACDQPEGYAADATDCDDYDLAANPGASEVCDAADTDEDCDGAADDADASTDASSWTTWFRDLDEDGYGDAGRTVSQCEAPTGYIADSTDCDDAEATIHPGAAEVCDAADTDEDCDGLADDDDGDATGATAWYRDADADGWGAGTGLDACEAPAGRVDADGDCDDGDGAVSPEATEVCDAADIDEDCDGLVDDDDPDAVGQSAYFEDVDGDSFGAGVAVAACDAPPAHVEEDGDCDDLDPEINPDAFELCDGSGSDEDCDGRIDDDDTDVLGTSGWYADTDGDGYGGGAEVPACEAPSGHVADASDCDDGEAAIHPGAIEVCDAATTDEDCDGAADDADASVTGLVAWFRDQDGDTYGTLSTSRDACRAPTGYVADDEDCDDADGAIYPGAVELCDAEDNDCDGAIDEAAVDAPYWYRDADGDAFGDAGTTIASCDEPTGYVSDATDCDDAEADTSPDGTEVCDGADNDCDALVDESGAVGEPTWYADADADGYGDAASTSSGCSQPTGHVADASDCDDGDATVSPGATEVCDDGVDNDCDGTATGCGPASMSLSAADAEYWGEAAYDVAGLSVSIAGDMNGDGYDDLVVGGKENDTAAVNAGVAYVVLGRARLSSSSLSSASARFNGESASDIAGFSVSMAGDVNGDGYGDLVVGAPYNADGGSYAGSAYLVLGSSGISSVSLSAATAQYQGSYPELAGYAVAGAGDVDDDGYDDLIIGAPNTLTAPRGGGAYLILGGSSPASTALTSADARYLGEAADDEAGSRVAAAGDVDGDGHADMLIGAYRRSAYTGGAYLVLGSSLPASGSLSGADARYTAESTGNHAGQSVAGAGDVDADGYDDVLIGAPYNADGGDYGATYLILGGPSPASASLAAADAEYHGVDTDLAGMCVAGAGDLDDDGFDDILVGAPGNDDAGTDAGATYVILGSVEPASASVSDAAAVYWGEAAGDYAGYAVGGGGDLDGDGNLDLVIGAHDNDDGGAGAGAAYVVLGSGL